MRSKLVCSGEVAVWENKQSRALAHTGNSCWLSFLDRVSVRSAGFYQPHNPLKSFKTAVCFLFKQ